jgi:hypothetical protein
MGCKIIVINLIKLQGKYYKKNHGKYYNIKQ